MMLVQPATESEGFNTPFYRRYRALLLAVLRRMKELDDEEH